MHRTTKADADRGRVSLRAQRYKDRADYLRRMARSATDAGARAELLRLARDYDSLAGPGGDKPRRQRRVTTGTLAEAAVHQDA